MKDIDKLSDLTPRMAGWRITNLDYREVLQQPWVGEPPLLFCDPPYKIGTGLYGDRGNTHKGFDHEAFREAVQAAPNNVVVMITYNAAQEIRMAYSEWQQVRFDAGYSVRSDRRYRRQQKGRRELLLLRY
jgi:DNA adenine methylase